MKSLTKQQQESYESAKMCYIYKEKFDNKDLRDIIIERNIIMLETIVNIQGNIEVLYIPQNSRYSAPENIPQIFIMDLTMIITLSQKSQRKNLENYVLVKQKTLKNT